MSLSSNPLPFLSLPGQDSLRRMLQLADWHKVSGRAGVHELWAPRSDSDSARRSAVLLPLDAERGDYEILRREAFDQLRLSLSSSHFSALEQRVATELSADIASTEWRRETESPPGTIPWIEGVRLHELITRQLVAAAKSTVQPRAVQGRSNAYVADEFLAKTVLAPSGVGSYVATALTPVTGLVFVAPEPRQRKRGQTPERPAITGIEVLQTLDRALAAISNALESHRLEDQSEAIVGSVGTGVSFELVSSLRELASDGQASVVVPARFWTDGIEQTEYTFQPKDLPALTHAADLLGREDDATSATLTGVVTFLKKEPGGAQRTVQIFTTSEGPVRRVRAELTEEDYQTAIKAHGDSELVRVNGPLRKRGKFWFIEPTSFEMLPSRESQEELNRAVEGEDDLFSGYLME